MTLGDTVFLAKNGDSKNLSTDINTSSDKEPSTHYTDDVNQNNDKKGDKKWI